MMLLIQDKAPDKAAIAVPDKLKFKQLLELCQLICSCGYCDVFKPLPTGKSLQNWIKRNPTWTFTYGHKLLQWCIKNLSMQTETIDKFIKILSSLPEEDKYEHQCMSAIFRYRQGYYTSYKNNVELPIAIATIEYKKYLKWKGYAVGK